MSELTSKDSRTASRLELLVTASAAALMASALVSVANAADTDPDRPTVWIEVGGQLERIGSEQSIFAPAFLAEAKPSILAPMVDAQAPPNYGLASESKITIAPSGSNWIFSAALRYGRANGGKHLHHEQAVSIATQVFPSPQHFLGDGLTNYHDTSLTLDFQAGKDVGLGMFGSGGSSTISAGIRIAQFTSNSNVKLQALPYIHNSLSTIFPSKYGFRNRDSISYTAVLSANRSTQAMGPSLSWEASMLIREGNGAARLDFDWGMNASVLFGRQKAQVSDKTSIYHVHLPPTMRTRSTQIASPPNRSNSVVIPNIGGFAGLSFRYAEAKVSFGYRADFFFGAIDQGYSTRKNSNIGFYGPFATIAIGLGG